MISRRLAGGSAWRRRGWPPWQAARCRLRVFWISPHHCVSSGGAGSVCPHLRGAPPRQV